MSEAVSLRAERLVLRYPGAARPVLAGFDLKLHASEIVAVLGPSGVGKSSLLRLVAGLDRPDAGTVDLGADRLDDAAVLVPVGLAFILFAEPLIDLLYGDRYEQAIVPLRFLGAMVVFLGINELAAMLVIARERPLAFCSVVAAVLFACAIGLALPLLPVWIATGLVPRLPTALLATGLVLLGCLALVCGLILDSLAQARL